MAPPLRRARGPYCALGLAALLAFVGARPAQAQSILRGALDGAVQDSRGALIPGVQVVITEARTQNGSGRR